jgi:hypothetical protein
MGRPKLENKRRKTAGVIVSERELEVLELLKADLGYRSVSALLRSAISKGIEVSTHGTFTSSQDIVYWQYWKKNWNLFEHLEENELHLKSVEKSIEKSVDNLLKKK